MRPTALLPWLFCTWTWTWQMSFAASSPEYTPPEGSGEHAVRGEYAGAVAVIR